MDLNDIKKPKFLSLLETANFMEVSYITVYRMVKDGHLPATNTAKSGSRPIYGVLAEDIQAYYDRISDAAAEGHKGIDE